ncbi:hypothetical protein EQ832_12060 [Pseudomonas sp. ALS1131]|nr:Cro/CI family transcriptional regulator [Pseudomonas sp. ALS1131]TRO38580.1 hypothetical protein EQ832_12060 [Pseudomonas sp. ALS1131]
MLVHLHEYVALHGQEQAAKALGSSQSAISKALKGKRSILVEVVADVTQGAFELKRFPCGGRTVEHAPTLDEIIGASTASKQGDDSAVNPSSAEVASV